MQNKTIVSDIEREFIDLYKENRSMFEAKTSAPVNKVRRSGIRDFERLGIPGKKNEDYKHTPLQPLFKNGYRKYVEPQRVEFDLANVFQCDIPTLDAHLVLLVNGFFDKKNGDYLRELSSGIIIGSLAAASFEYPELFEKHYGKYASHKDGLVALNSAFAQDGIFLYVPEGSVYKKPIQIVNLVMAKEDIMVQHRNLIIVEKNAEAGVIICDHAMTPYKFLTNSVTEIYTAENAFFDYVRVQNEHNNAVQFSHIFVNQEAHSNMTSNIMTLHGGVVRNNVNVLLNGEGAENNSYGLYLVDREQHVDNYIFIDHAKPNCFSSQLYKGVLDDFATGVFNGRILVRKDSQKTHAYQANNNILLTDDAKINTKPQLEIYADDVKCSHGATVGQLDEEAMFYMRTRGIPEKEARLIMMFAFAHEVIGNVKAEALLERIDDLVEKRLKGELSPCDNCAMKCY
ncbi:MAG: Fe-S cluster assembly protein SufD [Bacteroidales bacterium]|jgi:Fe-S cluster assembly protein SufD|nr:Fe-S cluster assembly protein SufD [Bacteroidales bacterium]